MNHKRQTTTAQLNFNRTIQLARVCMSGLLAIALLSLLFVSSVSAQEEKAQEENAQQEPSASESKTQDPATATPVIEETLRTIREVENLNKYIEQNQQLKTENSELKKQLASLTQQVQKLTKEIATQNETIRKQLLALPEMSIQSKVIGQDGARAILDIGGKRVRIREKVEMSIPVENGVWTLIQVEKITTDVVEINFRELDRVVTIYD